jgi:ketosteroid isomerase-like protein
MGERDEVLFANERFYRAFADADIREMNAVWADDRDDVSVVHPGAPAVAGRAGVLETWQAIFEGEQQVDIAFSDAVAYFHDDVAIVLCTETVMQHNLTATNIFCRTPHGWRMIHHHAGPCNVARRNRGQSRPVLH